MKVKDIRDKMYLKARSIYSKADQVRGCVEEYSRLMDAFDIICGLYLHIFGKSLQDHPRWKPSKDLIEKHKGWNEGEKV